MEAAPLLAFQFTLSLAAYTAIAGLFVWPWLRARQRRDALSLLLLPQLFRHVGVTLLAPGVVDPALPADFARQTAWGDTLTVGLAWLALLALRTRWRYAMAAVWLFNVIGLADMLNNLLAAVRIGAAAHLHAAWYGPAFVVPLMLVVHALVFAVLLRGESR